MIVNPTVGHRGMLTFPLAAMLTFYVNVLSDYMETVPDRA